MGVPIHIAAQNEQADELLDALEKAAACGIANDVMNRVAKAGGFGTAELLSAVRKYWREYPGRGKGAAPVLPGEVTLLREGCEALALDVRARSLKAQLNSSHLTAEAIFSAVVSYQCACANAPVRKRGRGRPSKLKTPEATWFIRTLAEIWRAYTNRRAFPGDGDTTTMNMNHFILRAFALAGVEAKAYSLPRVVEAALAN